MTERRRRFLNVLSRLSIAGAVAVICLWIISYWVAFSLDCTSLRSGIIQVECRSGELYFLRLDASKPGLTFTSKGKRFGAEPSSPYGGWAALNLPQEMEKETVLGLADLHGSNFGLTLVPLWAIALLLTLFPFWWARHPRNVRRVTIGICADCGYDLRGSTNQCPECGRAFTGPLNVTPPPPVRKTSEKSAATDKAPDEPNK